MKRNIVFYLLLCLLFTACTGKPVTLLTPGTQWLDTEGNLINAHGGGILYHRGKYYWYGEYKGDSTYWNPKVPSWECYRTEAGGVSCYSSDDLVNWKFEGVVLKAEQNDTASELHYSNVLERPKVIYNERTGKFVMWLHVDSHNYGKAAAGVAVCDSPTGDFQYLGSMRPNGQMSRDMTLFKDDDGKAYHVYSSEHNRTLYISLLTDDYLRPSGIFTRNFVDKSREAPAVFKRNNKYYLLSSGCTAWDPNQAEYAVADSMLGKWTVIGNPCSGKDAEKTFYGQSTFVLPVAGKKDAFIAMFDKWNKTDLINSRYIWLPVTFKGDSIDIEWREKWDLNVFDCISEASQEWKLVWSDEFDIDGKPDSAVWTYERGFVRNHELQWYQPDNAVCKNGVLILSGRKEKVPNPNYSSGSGDWHRNRQYAEYTASSIKTAGKKEFQYGRFEVRAKIPTASGSWPAIWMLGNSMPWPSCGEIDIMEYYRINDVPHILANAAWGTDTPHKAKWDDAKIPFSQFTAKDPDWANKFHIWRMDWDETAIRLYLDDELLNEILLSETVNGTVGNYQNPFRQPHYILLNLAIGGDNGGTPDDAAFPLQYEIDYARVYKKGNVAYE